MRKLNARLVPRDLDIYPRYYEVGYEEFRRIMKVLKAAQVIVDECRNCDLDGDGCDGIKELIAVVDKLNAKS